ncbi:Palmitoyltransferase ZDHHC15B [Acropora cervicornis]|uniref:Palmitoyltransferase n=1 Tax=Acropora cervicornis TaxID=6130 RepID=A0AAD9R175_ACRCE|nr:Palmitoyltransferase ZDHHC15B [Acropora cervicornis]
MAFVWVIILSVGLIQGVFIISSLQTLFPRGSRKKCLFRVLKGLQITPVLFIFASAIWFFFVVILPIEVANTYLSLKSICYTFIASYLWLNMVFNYLAAMIVSPGYPETRQELEEDTDIHLDSLKFCSKCSRVRDRGTHHCSSCSTCVLLMSHHCPFTNNCVGLNNFAYFFLFLMQCSFGLVFAAYSTYQPFLSCMMYYKSALYTADVCKELGDYAVMFLVVTFVLLFMFIMLSFHTFLLIVDISMIDFLKLCQKLTFKEWVKDVFIERGLQKKKVLLRKLLLFRREKWWKFLVPAFNEIPELLPPDQFLV